MKKLGNKIEKIVSVDSEKYKIQVKFKDGVTGELNLSDIFSHVALHLISTKIGEYWHFHCQYS